MDAISMAKQSEDDGRKPFVALMDVEIREDGREYIQWAKRGQQNPAVCSCRVDRMPKFYADVWAVIEPQYKAYKEGSDTPVIGTPLAAWPGVTKQIVKILADRKIRSVEEFAAMEDSALGSIQLPGIRDKHRQAKAFIEAKASTSLVAEENVKLKEEVEFLKREMRELRSLVAQGAEQEPDSEPVKRKGGWPKGKPRKPVVHAWNPDNDGTRVA